MKIFLQVFLLLSLSFSVVLADTFGDARTIRLKKDEVKKILVKYDKITKLFKFNWTLYHNNGLVIHRSYDKIVAQNILYLRHKNRSFRVNLTSKGAGYYSLPYMLVKFKEFDYETDEAIFELFLSDRELKITLKYLQNG